MELKTMSIDKAHWSAVFSLFLGVTSLIAAEFLPISLLTPMAAELNISEGMAGQAVTAVGVFAVTTSILLAPLTQKIDRRTILLSLSALLLLSNFCVALSSNYAIMLVGRCILGICVGGFWSMASAVTLRLVPKKSVPKALSLIYAGVSVATIISIPLASYLGQFIDWREIFYLASFLGAVAFIWQYCSLPKMPAKEGSSFGTMGHLLKKGWVLAGLSAMIFSYGGYHVFFTYLRPFLEYDLALHANQLALVLLAFGIANCLGTFAAGFILGYHFRLTILLIHIILACVAMGLLVSGNAVMKSSLLVMAWGFIFGIIPVAWSSWIVRTLADKAEIAGGLMVAAIQLSVSIGAAIGGIVFDQSGVEGIFVVAFLFLCSAIAMTLYSFSGFFREIGRHV